jgi:hypothetical protein
VEIIPDKRRLVGLVEQAHQGKLCLPNFQRDFVWTREEVADLVRSILRAYFVGSVLLLRCDPDKPPFAPVALRGAQPATVTPMPELLVLDGQQRLSSILYALTAPEGGLKNSKQRRWFFVDLDALLRDIDDDAIVFDRTERERRRDGLDSTAGQWRNHTLPCTALLASKSFLTWRDGLDDWLREHSKDDHNQFREEWRDGWTAAVTGFQEFQVPVVELPRVDDTDQDAVARVCAIFEKLNSTGVELSVYDLLTARLFRSQIDLHQLWEEAVEAHPLVAEWSEGSADTNKFGVLMLRTLALMRDLEPKPKTLINLAPKNFVEDWRRSVAAMERALELVTHIGPDGFAVFERKWLPGFGVLPVLAALRADIEDRKLGDDPRADLRRYYWCNVFLERYSSQVETKSRRDWQEMRAHWNGGPAPSLFIEAQARIGAEGYTVSDSASYASAVYSGIFCLLAQHGARDWVAGEAIALQQLEDHHIFPRSYLTGRGFDSRKDKARINSVLNRTLIANETNGRISDSAPAQYLADAAVFPQEPLALLRDHFVDEATLAAMQKATTDLDGNALAGVYDEFCRARQAVIVAEIRRVCGVQAGKPAPAEAEGIDDE